MALFFWTVAGFLLGAVPFSLLVGRLALGKDIRQYGDQNPGATNVLRAGGFPWFALALALDISKGAVPVGLAYQIAGLQGWEAVPIALAPTLGHAFSPFLNWKGGKAIAVTLGVWIGLTIWPIPLVGILSLSLFALLVTPSGWALMFTLLTILLVLILWLPNPIFLATLFGQAVLFGWTHRAELTHLPRLRQPRAREQA